MEKWRDEKLKNFQQNVIKEQWGRKSHADTDYRKAAKNESILSGSKLEHRVIVDRNENCPDLSKTKGKCPFSAEITPSKNKNVMDNRKFRKKEVRHMQRHCKVLEHQTLMGTFMNHWKHRISWKKKIIIFTEQEV